MSIPTPNAILALELRSPLFPPFPPSAAKHEGMWLFHQKLQRLKLDPQLLGRLEQKGLPAVNLSKATSFGGFKQKQVMSCRAVLR